MRKMEGVEMRETKWGGERENVMSEVSERVIAEFMFVGICVIVSG